MDASFSVGAQASTLVVIRLFTRRLRFFPKGNLGVPSQQVVDTCLLALQYVQQDSSKPAASHQDGTRVRTYVLQYVRSIAIDVYVPLYVHVPMVPMVQWYTCPHMYVRVLSYYLPKMVVLQSTTWYTCTMIAIEQTN